MYDTEYAKLVALVVRLAQKAEELGQTDEFRKAADLGHWPDSNQLEIYVRDLCQSKHADIATLILAAELVTKRMNAEMRMRFVYGTVKMPDKDDNIVEMPPPK